MAGPIAPQGEGGPLLRYSSCLDRCRASIVYVYINQFCVLTGVIDFEALLASSLYRLLVLDALLDWVLIPISNRYIYIYIYMYVSQEARDFKVR